MIVMQEVPVRTTMEKFAWPLALGGIVGFGAYHMSTKAPEIFGIGFGALTAVIVSK